MLVEEEEEEVGQIVSLGQFLYRVCMRPFS